LISYRQSDLLDQFGHDNEVVGVAYLDFRNISENRFVMDFHLSISVSNVQERAATVAFCEDIYEGLPSNIRAKYQQHPMGYRPHHADMYTLTLEFDHESTSPKFIFQCFNQRFENRDLENDVLNPPHAINAGSQNEYFIMGEWHIKAKDLGPFMKQASISYRKADLLEEYKPEGTFFIVKFLLTPDDKDLCYVSSRLGQGKTHTQKTQEQRDYLEYVLFPIFDRVGFHLDGGTWTFTSAHTAEDAPHIISQVKHALKDSPRFSDISGGIFEDGPNRTSFSVNVS